LPAAVNSSVLYQSGAANSNQAGAELPQLSAIEIAIKTGTSIVIRMGG